MDTTALDIVQSILALVKLNSSQSDSIRMRERLCLPPSISLQNRVSDCFLLGKFSARDFQALQLAHSYLLHTNTSFVLKGLLSTNDNRKSFVELPATILSTKECRQNVQANTKKSPDLIGQVSTPTSVVGLEIYSR